MCRHIFLKDLLQKSFRNTCKAEAKIAPYVLAISRNSWQATTIPMTREHLKEVYKALYEFLNKSIGSIK